MTAAPALDDLWAALDDDCLAETVVDHVGLQRVGPVAVLTLHRPKQHNVLTLAGWLRIGAVADALARDQDLRVVVLRGAGNRVFGAGADISEFPLTRMSASLAVTYNEAVGRALQSLADIPVPVIAMIQGLAVGGALELSCACDVRLAAQDARLGLPIGRLGVTLGYTEARAIARLIGPSELKFLLLSGELIDAGEALRIGLVQRVVAREDLVRATLALVDNILASSEPTLRAGKLVADMVGRPITAADTEALTRITVGVYGGADLDEGVAAFAQRRAPAFPSRHPAARDQSNPKEGSHGRA